MSFWYQFYSKQGAIMRRINQEIHKTLIALSKLNFTLLSIMLRYQCFMYSILISNYSILFLVKLLYIVEYICFLVTQPDGCCSWGHLGSKVSVSVWLITTTPLSTLSKTLSKTLVTSQIERVHCLEILSWKRICEHWILSKECPGISGVPD